MILTVFFCLISRLKDERDKCNALYQILSRHYKACFMPLHMPIWEPTVALLPLKVGQLKEEEVQD